jgi:DNA ligase-1
MTPFAALLERLVFTPGRLAKIALLRDYFAHTSDPDRGYALAAIAGDLSFTAAKPAMIRQITEARVDATLFAWSYDYVGDLAETVSLIWPGAAPGTPPRLSEVVAALRDTTKLAMPDRVAAWMDVCDPSERLALLKLITGGLRVGASARLAKIALGEMADVPPDDIEEVWHGLAPPYAALFDWLEGRAPKPDAGGAPVFRPTMLAHPLEEADARGSTGPPIGRSGSGTASACSWWRRRRGAGSTRAPPRIFPTDSPKSSRRWSSTACWTASCW